MFGTRGVANYTRTVEFTAKDGQIKKAIKDITRDLSGVDKKVNKINNNFTSLSKAFKTIGTEFIKLSKTIDNINKGSKKSPLNQKALNKGVVTLTKIKNLNKQIAKEGPLLSGSGVTDTKWIKQLDTLKGTVKTLAEAGGVFNKSEAGLMRQAKALQEISRQTQVATSKNTLYSLSIKAAAKAEQELVFKQLKRLEVQSRFYAGKQKTRTGEGYSNALSLAAMTDTIGTEKGIAKNIASLNVYKAELQKALSLVELQGTEYKKVEEAIQKVNNILDNGNAIERKAADDRKAANNEERRVEREMLQFGKNRLKLEKDLAKVKKDAAKENKKFLWQAAKATGKTLIGKGPLGWVGQTAALVGITKSVHELARAVNALNPAWGKTEKIASSHLQNMILGVAGVKGAAIGLQKVLSAADWVGKAIKGFMAFEDAAANIIWSVERNYRNAFSAMGKMVRELPMMASAAMMMMPEWMGGRGLSGSIDDWFATGKGLDRYRAAGDAVGARRKPSLKQSLEARLEVKERNLAATDPEDRNYARRLQEIYKLRQQITQEIQKAAKATREFSGIESTEVQEAAKKQLEMQKKGAELEERKTKWKKKNEQINKRLVKQNGQMLDIDQRIEKVQKRKEARRLANQRLPENLMLGAGFPMLFGGGAGSVGGGLLGAGLQYATASQGFGAQIFFSAIGQQIDAFVAKTAELGKAFNDINPNVDAVVASLGVTNTAYGRHIEMLKAIEGEAAAMAEATKKLAQLIGQQGVKSLKQFGNDAQDFGNEMGKAFTLMKASVAELINSSGILLALTNQISRANRFGMFEAKVKDIKASGKSYNQLNDQEKEIMNLWSQRQSIVNNVGASPVEKIEQNVLKFITKSTNPFGYIPGYAEWETRTPQQKKELLAHDNSVDEFMRKYQASQAIEGLYGSGASTIAGYESKTKLLNEKMDPNIGERQAKINNEIKQVMKTFKTEKDKEDNLEGVTAAVKAFYEAEDNYKKFQDKNKLEQDYTKKLADLDKEIAGQKELMNMEHGSYELREREAEIARETAGLEGDKLKQVKDRLNTLYDLQDVNENIRQQEEQVKAVYDAIGVSIRDGLVEGINAAIDGTKTLGEVASNTFRRISNALLNYGVNIGLSSLPGVGHIFAAALGTNVGKTKVDGEAANGGPVKGGGTYLVGEKGPELFVPGSSGNIVPNHAMGGSTNVVVNVDASGSSVEGDAGQAEQLGSMLAAAVQSEIANQQRPGGLLARR